MASFQYKAAGRDGEVVTGTLEGASVAEVVAHLQALGQVPIRVEAGAGAIEPGPSPRRGFGRRRIKAAEIEGFTAELATLLQAGLPLDRALGVLGELAPSARLGEVVGRVRERVQQGLSLADALAEHPAVYSRLYVNLVRAGEAGGALEAVLARMADHLGRMREARDAVVSALIYPVILVLVAVTAVLLLLTYVVPQFAQLFADVGQALPLPTRVVIASGEFLQQWGWSLPLVLAALALVLRQVWRRPEARRTLQRRMLRLVLVGDLLRKVETARFARTLATLLANGVSLLDALRIAREVVLNLEIAARLEQAAQGVREGRRLAEQLEGHDVVPTFAVQMLRVGEESGDLAGMLLRVAEVYDREVQGALKRTLAVLEPALILVLGVLVAGIVLSILVAILGVNQLVF